MPVKRSRVFSRGFKLDAVARVEAGENVSRLARELGVRRKLLYEWRDAWRAGGEDALRPPGRGGVWRGHGGVRHALLHC